MNQGADYTAPFFGDKLELLFWCNFLWFSSALRFCRGSLDARATVLGFSLTSTGSFEVVGAPFLEVRPSELTSTVVAVLGLVLGSLLALAGALVAFGSAFGADSDSVFGSAFVSGCNSADGSDFTFAFAFALALAFALGLGFDSSDSFDSILALALSILLSIVSSEVLTTSSVCLGFVALRLRFGFQRLQFQS